MLQASAVVVWEWLSEHGRWRPYSPTVSHHIEEVIRSDPRGGSVVLGRADSRLSPYIIDLHSMHQFRQDTGKMKTSNASLYLWQAIITFILYNEPVSILCYLLWNYLLYMYVSLMETSILD